MVKSWQARRDDLVEALRILNLVSSRDNASASNFFVVESANDGMISMRVAGASVAEVNIAGTGIWPYVEPFFIDRKIFSPFVLASKEIRNKFPFEFFDKEELVVRHGRRKATFSPQPAIAGYAFLGSMSKSSKLDLSPEIIRLMNCCATCASTELSNAFTSCVFMNPTDKGVDLLATNGTVGLRVAVKLDIPIDSPIPFPLPMMEVIQAGGLKSLRWGKNCIIGKFDTGKVWQTIMVESLKEFPVQTTTDIIASGRDRAMTVFQVSAYKFAKVMDRLALYLQSVNKADWVLEIVGKKGLDQIQITAKMPGSSVREQITVLGTLQKDFVMEWPLAVMNSVFQFVGKNEEDMAMRVGLNSKLNISYVRCGPIELTVSSVTK